MDIWSQYVLPCLCAFAGCIGFTLVFNIHGPGKLIAGCGGALLPLVPGGGIYYAMGYCLEGDTEQFLSALLGTLGMAAALAVGVILASSLFRAVFPRLARVPKRMPSGRQNP